MIAFPKEEPVLENLNSYYLDVPKLLEHCQGQMECGAAHFAAAFAEGVLFFDKDGLLDGVYESREERLLGKEAAGRLMTATGGDNFAVAVFRIQAEEVYFWSSLLGATRVYEGLSAEFTDLEGLIRKMAAEKLSGYIEICLNASPGGGLIVFRNGHLLGSASSNGNHGLDRSPESRDAMIQVAKERGGVFHVSKISTPRPKAENGAPETRRHEILKAMDELLGALETHVHQRKSRKKDFGILFRKECIDLAETYPFLDPFAGELAYHDGTIHYRGDANEKRVAEGLLAVMNRLATEGGVRKEFQKSLEAWIKKHNVNPADLGLKP